MSVKVTQTITLDATTKAEYDSVKLEVEAEAQRDPSWGITYDPLAKRVTAIKSLTR